MDFETTGKGVDLDSSGRPIPDGKLVIGLQTKDKDGNYTSLEVLFKSIKTHSGDPNGISVFFEDHRLDIPWANIRFSELFYNSDDYQLAVGMFQASCDHQWMKQDQPTLCGHIDHVKQCEVCDKIEVEHEVL